jgi:hypothetical protein
LNQMANFIITDGPAIGNPVAEENREIKLA